jgi:DNA primase
MIKRLAARVALTYDGDAAGQDAMMRSLGVLLGEGLEVAIVELPAGADPDTLVRERGAEGWREARARAYDAVVFVERHVLRAGGAGDARERALQALAALIAGLEDPLRREALVNRADEVFGVQIQGVRAALARAVALRRSGFQPERPIQATVQRQRADERFLERGLLQLLLLHPEGLDGTRARLSPEDFHDAACGAVARWLWSGAGEAPAGEAGALVRELAAGDPPVTDWNSDLERKIRLKTTRRLRLEMNERKEQLKTLPGGQKALELMREIEAIARSLRDLSA